MSLQSVVDDVKGRVEALGAQGQEVVKISVDTFKQANTLVVDSFNALLKDHSATAKDIYASAKSGFEKAKADGFKAVVTHPIAYLPSTEKLIEALNGTVSTFAKTGDELLKTVKSGFESVQSQLAGKPVVKKASAAAKSAAKSVKKATTGAKKQIKAAAKSV
ncbi:MAG: hypothetical protein JWR16_1696 [Nevskia sp.]|nr:hypothetical protein [Nevskia sp.]